MELLLAHRWKSPPTLGVKFEGEEVGEWRLSKNAEIGSQKAPRDIRMNRANPKGKIVVLRRNLLKTLDQGREPRTAIFELNFPSVHPRATQWSAPLPTPPHYARVNLENKVLRNNGIPTLMN